MSDANKYYLVTVGSRRTEVTESDSLEEITAAAAQLPEDAELDVSEVLLFYGKQLKLSRTVRTEVEVEGAPQSGEDKAAKAARVNRRLVNRGGMSPPVRGARPKK